MNTHAMCQAARAHEPCAVCHAKAGYPCDRDGAVHLCRIALATHDGHITMLDFATVIHDADVFAGWSLILDEAPAVSAEVTPRLASRSRIRMAGSVIR